MKLPVNLAVTAALFGAVMATAAGDFETPPDESPAMSLQPAQVAGENFHIQDPVHSDGLMHHYVVESRFGVFNAYGHGALTVRLLEVSALTTLDKTSETKVVLDSVTRSMEHDAKSVLRVATNPVGTVLGVPKGIKHLLSGYKAQADEISTQAKGGNGSQSGGNAVGKAASQAPDLAKHYADRYLGLSAAERRWYAKLGADPYTSNEVLRRAVKRLAKVDAAASFGMRFAPIGIPFAGEVTRALDAIYTEDPAVLRKRQHEALASYGLSPAEVEHFENTLLLNPTRQAVLINSVKTLDGVEGRAELLRHAAGITSEDEVEVYMHSTALLLKYHAQRPVTRIVAGLRIPAAQLASGTVVIFGAFDAVHWTEDVAGYESAIRGALPPGTSGREIWLTESASPRARAELEKLGWAVHDQGEAALKEHAGL